jgi:hypothetical protein
LVEQQLKAWHALDAAMLAMKAAAPHGRDYQTDDAITFRVALHSAQGQAGLHREPLDFL